MHGASGHAGRAQRFDAKASVLIESVTDHIEEEEQDWFPKVRAGLGANNCRNSGPNSSEPGRKHPDRLPSPVR
jgi:hypothetical protein